LLVSLIASSAMDGCRLSRRPSPGETYSEIHAAFAEGNNLAAAASSADAAVQRYSDRDPVWAWKFRMLEADILIDQGESLRVLSLLRDDLPANLAGDNLAVQREMFMALALSHVGKVSEANQAYSRAVSLCHQDACAAAGELARIGGSIELDRNDLDGAESSFEKSLRLARERGDKPLELSNLTNLGLVATLKEHYDESIAWFSQAQTMSRAMHNSIGEEKELGNLGWAYYKVGDFDKSSDYSRQAIQKARALKIEIDEIEWLDNVELVNLKLGRLEPAESDYRRSLVLAEKSQNQRQQIEALSALAYIGIQTGHPDDASSLIERALRLANGASDALEPLLLRGQLFASRGDLDRAAEVFASVADNPESDSSLRWEAHRELAETYAQLKETAQAGEEFQAALTTVRNARCGVTKEELRLPFLANATRVYGSYIDFLVQHGKSAEALKIADESRALTLAEGLGIEGKRCLASETAFDPQRTARHAQATILFYWLGTEHSYLWAVSPNQTKLYPLPPAAQLEAPLQAYRNALMGSRDVLATGETSGTALYQTLVAPAEEFFPAHGNITAKRVIVIVDGGLSGLNFETLINPKPRPHYWIEDVCVENASSLRLLAANSQKHPHGGGRLLLIGDPVPPKGSDYAPLPKAAKEMLSVQKSFPAASAQVYQQDNSTPAAYLDSHPGQYAYIHFVAHGVASLSDPLDSAVILSPTTPAAKDGAYKLYARDVMSHPLNAELVTVSTCKGAGIRNYTLEGLVGLSWAFLHAGAHNVIGALWDVSDESTPQLMSAMYAELVKGSPPDEALRSAKLSLLHSGTPFHKPYYWAPFQLYTGS
jgi:CHAT domain-containing protein